ncbi:conserved hypothetical protein [delta proteobacterium NaphS2]|nr:conserved hypothetical protein [delta proteobacterium NaphS2]
MHGFTLLFLKQAIKQNSEQFHLNDIARADLAVLLKLGKCFKDGQGKHQNPWLSDPSDNGFGVFTWDSEAPDIIGDNVSGAKLADL